MEISSVAEVRQRNPLETISGESAKLKVGRKDMPWANKDQEIELHKVRTQEEVEFYLGSFIKEKRLRRAASLLDVHRSRMVSNMLYNTLSEFVGKGYSPRVFTVATHRSPRPIYYAGNPGGQRVYFMRFDNIGDSPVIVKVAACDKAQQAEVLSVITTNSYRNIKTLGKL